MKLSAFAVLASLTTSTSYAASADLSAVYEFMTSKIEKIEASSPEKEFVIEEGALVGVSSMQRIVQNVVKKDNRISYMIIKKKVQTNYRLDAEGKKILPGTPVNATHVTECVFTKRESAQKILGLCSAVGESGWESAGEISLEGQTLTVKHKTATEFDDGYSATGNGWKPVTLTYDEEYTSLEGQLVMKSTEKGFDYDLATGKTAEAPYAQISRELKSAKK